jgi:hypothetical protein
MMAATSVNQLADARVVCSLRTGQIIVVRGHQDANENMHFAAVSKMLAAEGDLTVGAHCMAEEQLVGTFLGRRGVLSVMDMGGALRKQHLLRYPDSNILFCGRHMTETLASSPDLLTYKQLLHLPKGHPEVANTLYNSLSKTSVLRKHPKEQVASTPANPITIAFF